jgi:hypothetical protein
MTTRNKVAFSWLLGLLLFADYLFLAIQQDIRSSIPGLVAVTALAVTLLAVLLYMGEKEQLQLSPGAILSLGLACRLLFLFQSPRLSDDIYRYLWDGLQILHGNNPYSLTPATSVAFDAWSTTILKKVNHPHLFTAYPPAAQIIFAAGAALAKDYVGLKVILVTLDMSACAVIVKLLRTMNLPTWRAALYAWHPLPIIEIAGSGHIDGAALLFFLIAVSLAVATPMGIGLKESDRQSGRWKILARHLGGGTAIAFSVLVKLIPLIYLPLLLCAATGPLCLAAGCVAALGLFSIPFLPDLTHMFVTLGIYLQNWEFANAAFRTLRVVLASRDRAKVVLACLSAILIVVITLSFWRRAKEQADTAPPDLMKSFYFVTLAFLLLTPTLHPWYALYLAAFLPFAAGPAGLVLSWAVFLSYHVLIRYSILGEWVESDLISGAIWCSPALAWFVVFAGEKIIIRFFRPSSE